MIEKNGNLFDTTAKHIGHGVNVYGLMGAGIAKEFKRRYPKNFDRYHAACMKGALTPGSIIVTYEDDVYVHNIASQDRPGRHAQYNWLADGLMRSASFAEKFDDKPVIAIPEIGCGIGGLDWSAAETIIGLVEQLYEVEFEVWHYDG